MSTILILDSNDNIHEIKGAKQILIYRKEEKITFTTILSINFSGKVLST